MLYLLGNRHQVLRAPEHIPGIFNQAHGHFLDERIVMHLCQGIYNIQGIEVEMRIYLELEALQIGFLCCQFIFIILDLQSFNFRYHFVEIMDHAAVFRDPAVIFNCQVPFSVSHLFHGQLH